MSASERRRRKSATRKRVVWGLLFALVFAVGVALGQALEDNPRPSSTITHDRTFTPLPAPSTVTVTAP